MAKARASFTIFRAVECAKYLVTVENLSDWNQFAIVKIDQVITGFQRATDYLHHLVFSFNKVKLTCNVSAV